NTESPACALTVLGCQRYESNYSEPTAHAQTYAPRRGRRRLGKDKRTTLAGRSIAKITARACDTRTNRNRRSRQVNHRRSKCTGLDMIIKRPAGAVLGLNRESEK